jgi:hypothetical protein
VKGPRLTADNATEEPVDFRSLRDSYATWLALAGVRDKRIQRRLGHASNQTTDRYIKAAEAFDVAAIGEPFPGPTEIAFGPAVGPTRGHKTTKPRNYRGLFSCAGAIGAPCNDTGSRCSSRANATTT